MFDSQTINILSNLVQWIVMPVCAFVWLIYREQQVHNTAIAVLQAETASAKSAHDREIKEIRETSKAIMEKLNSIEEALRK